jgi:4'-phosphopantetheinyl transferase
MLSGRPMPDAATVHVYYARAHSWTAEAISEGQLLLDPEETARAARFRFERDRTSYIGSHALLRRALSRHESVDPRAWRFAAQSHGRPEIAVPSTRLRFSLSHTRGLAACAIGVDLELGLDVEDTTRGAPLDVAERWFAPPELADLLSFPTSARGDRFFMYWTLKEAYMKARGLGLSLPLDGFWFAISQSKIAASFGPACPDDAASWRFRSWIIDPGYRAALAIRSAAIVDVEVSRDEAARGG